MSAATRRMHWAYNAGLGRFYGNPCSAEAIIKARKLNKIEAWRKRQSAGIDQRMAEPSPSA